MKTTLKSSKFALSAVLAGALMLLTPAVTLAQHRGGGGGGGGSHFSGGGQRGFSGGGQRGFSGAASVEPGWPAFSGQRGGQSFSGGSVDFRAGESFSGGQRGFSGGVRSFRGGGFDRGGYYRGGRYYGYGYGGYYPYYGGSYGGAVLQPVRLLRCLGQLDSRLRGSLCLRLRLLRPSRWTLECFTPGHDCHS